ncbi:hypothetical protein PUN28_004595 [Cardiocondyla obscurior]|uniref:Uncharacterized protein n=1 Tax=Cardiocondyla obscurior TaxID=286306 RepID=A0AAW2GBM1_9HYME
MQPFSGVLLLLFICQLATPTPIFNKAGEGFQSRAGGVGDTIRDWFRELKDRIVGKWQEWFGNDNPTPRLSPQDIFNIDKTIESRIPNYPGLFLDLSSLSFDPKRDWGVRIGNWYIIRKVTGSGYDSDSNEWDMRPLLPSLPSPPVFEPDWTPKKSGTPEGTKSPTTTPRIESTTSRQQTVQTESPLIPTEPGITTSEATAVISTESTPLTTQLITTSIEPIVEPTSSEEVITSSESVVTNSEPVAGATEFVLTSNSITDTTVPSIGSTVFPDESIPFTQPTSVKSIETSIESTLMTTETIMTSREELTTINTTELPITTTELILPIFNKRVEENETIDKPRTTKKPRPASAEVIM